MTLSIRAVCPMEKAPAIRFALGEFTPIWAGKAGLFEWPTRDHSPDEPNPKPLDPQPNTDADPSASAVERDCMKKEMLINVLQPEECRIAIIEDGVLEELYVERTSHESYTGNIYKGRIVNLEPAIQAAFVDFSVGRNGFLHVSDVEPQYFER